MAQIIQGNWSGRIAETEARPALVLIFSIKKALADRCPPAALQSLLFSNSYELAATLATCNAQIPINVVPSSFGILEDRLLMTIELSWRQLDPAVDRVVIDQIVPTANEYIEHFNEVAHHRSVVICRTEDEAQRLQEENRSFIYCVGNVTDDDFSIDDLSAPDLVNARGAEGIN